ncbi:outer membrane protein transport protein [Photobacterium sp. WH77]|uniref:outer membrane protein transport protein n=1 Tax=unclassified Photobacterium TaxID=2628852 RepID=UPI001EDA4BF7|nr:MULTISPECIES: outer membrane protein transport protein [unclassified Photobacterium]MCG2835791.1 outer membrane protein transport protein [Photobacterium sp. WH77]MCG2843532.1 outer membrane protein transport protein [Photobacterium sp. WH80]
MSKRFHVTALAVAAALTSLQAQSAGFQVAEHSASGLGRAFAGEAAIADNAAVLARNPAASTMFKQRALSGGLSIVDPAIDVDSVNRDQKANDIAPPGFVPAGYYIQPINDKLAFGLALFSNYGVTTDYDPSFHAGSSAGETSLITVNFNPSIAYRVNKQLSLGAGVSAIYGSAELNRFLGDLAVAVPGADPSDKSVNMEGDTWGFGWNVGALFELNDNNRFGLSYRSQTDMDFEGDFTDYTGRITGSPNNTVPGDLTVVLPAIAEFSGFHQLNNQWAVHYSVQWTQYSKFEELRATGDQCVPGYGGSAGLCLLKDEKYDDTFRYAIGTTYNINTEWTVRGGYAFDEQAGKPTLSIPDTDRNWFTAGATYNYNANLSFDAGIAYLIADELTFTEDGDTFESSGGAIIASGQVNYSF